MTVRMFLVGRLLRGVDANQADEVRGRVGERVEAVRQHADGAARIAERDLGRRDCEVQQKDADEDACNGGIARGGYSRLRIRDACGCGIRAHVTNPSPNTNPQSLGPRKLWRSEPATT